MSAVRIDLLEDFGDLLEMRHRIGVGRVMWGNDFPHSAGDWPHSREVIDEMFGGVPDDQRARMLAANAVEFFGLAASRMRGDAWPAGPAMLLASAVALLVGCTGPSPGQTEAGGPAAPAQRKTITVALRAQLNALVTELGVFGALSRPTSDFHAFVHSNVSPQRSG